MYDTCVTPNAAMPKSTYWRSGRSWAMITSPRREKAMPTESSAAVPANGVCAAAVLQMRSAEASKMTDDSSLFGRGMRLMRASSSRPTRNPPANNEPQITSNPVCSGANGRDDIWCGRPWIWLEIKPEACLVGDLAQVGHHLGVQGDAVG